MGGSRANCHVAAIGNQCEGRLKWQLSTLPFCPESSLTGLTAAEEQWASGSEGDSFRRSSCSRKGFVAPPRLLCRPQHQPQNSDTCCLSFFPQTSRPSALQAFESSPALHALCLRGWPSLCGMAASHSPWAPASFLMIGACLLHKMVGSSRWGDFPACFDLLAHAICSASCPCTSHAIRAP